MVIDNFQLDSHTVKNRAYCLNNTMMKKASANSNVMFYTTS